MKKLGIHPQEVQLSGGGTKSTLWKQMLADIFDAPCTMVNAREGAAYGAALLASVGSGSSRMWKLHAGHGFEKRKQSILGKMQRFIKRMLPSTKIFIQNLRKLLDKLHLWKTIKED